MVKKWIKKERKEILEKYTEKVKRPKVIGEWKESEKKEVEKIERNWRKKELEGSGREKI